MATAAVETRKAFTPGKIGDLQLRNRIIRAGCFEGMCQEGSCSDRLIEHHRAVAKGGAAMTRWPTAPWHRRAVPTAMRCGCEKRSSPI